MSFLRKIFLLLVFFLIIFSSVFLLKVNSQEDEDYSDNPIAKSGYSLMCLNASTSDAEWFDGWCSCTKNDDGNCPKDCIPDTGQVKGDGQCIRQCELSIPPRSGIANFILKNPLGNKIPPNTKFYIVIPQGSGFTTTIDNLDSELGLLKSDKLKLIYPSNPSGVFFSDKNGDINVTGIMQGELVGHRDYLFYALYNPSVVETNYKSSNEGEEKSLQLGSFSFFNFENQENSIQKCASIYWDPFGRVFDSISLEPIPNIELRILTEIYPEEKIARVIGVNPIVTKEDGVFNFLTEPGYYYIRLNGIPYTHNFIDNPKLNPLYSEIYRKSSNAKRSIYKPDELIAEIIDTPEEQKRGYPFPEERDIPLDPGNNKPYTSSIIHMFIQQNIDDVDGGKIVFKGKASHPYPIVILKDDKGRIIYEKEFNDERARYGFWIIKVNKKVLPTDTNIRIQLRKNKKYFKYDETLKISSVKILEPILSYIEGYTKDSFGNIIPKALVRIRLSMNNRIYYQTYSDEKGYFRITSDKLPPFSYYIEINGNKVSTSEFVKSNKEYITKNKINLMSNIYSKDFIDKVKNNKNENNFNNNSFKNNKEESIKSEENLLKNNYQLKLIFYVLIIFFILIISFVLAYFFFVKKNKI